MYVIYYVHCVLLVFSLSEFPNFSGMDANNPASQAAFSQLMQQMVTNMAGQGQNSPPEERFRVQLETLTSMGFVDRQANIQGNLVYYPSVLLRKEPTKGGFISESYSLWLQSPKKCQITPLSIFSRWIVLRGVNWHLCLKS
jgi:hypothetical protein